MSAGAWVVRCVALPAILLLVSAATGYAQVPQPGVSLKVSREVAPPGAIAQMKVFVTEPKPITTGYAGLEFDAYDDVVGIALASGDTAGIAVVRGGQIALSVLSPSGTFGTDLDYPVLTIAGRVAATAQVGVRIPMSIDPASLQLTDSTGAVYPAEVKDGYLLSGGELSIGDVVPGSADLSTGDVVSIFGTGFSPDSKVRLKETPLADVQYVSPTRIDVVLAAPARMHGKAIRVKNRDGFEVTYFSYQRTHRSGSTADPVLRDVVPIFAGPPSGMQAIDVFETTAGLALQNLDATDTLAFVEFLDAGGSLLASGTIEVPASSYVVRSLSEIFGSSLGTSGVITVAGAAPLQALGVEVDASGRVTPRVAR